MLINAHAHLASPGTALADIRRINIGNTLVLLNTSSPSEFTALLPLTKSSTRIRLALGMHPLYVGSASFTSFFALSNHTSYIGEIGLDNSRSKTVSLQKQQVVLETILERLAFKDKVIMVHSRNAEKETLELLRKYHHDKVIFHWYTGALDTLEELVDCGFYFSINPKMLLSAKNERLLELIPYDKILPETDTPYCVINSRKLTYHDVSIVYRFLSGFYSYPMTKVENDLMQNLHNLIGVRVDHPSTN